MNREETVRRLKMLRRVMTDLEKPSLGLRIKRWLRLAPKAPSFDMTDWCTVTTEKDTAQAGIKHSCGTVVCALGYAAIRPEFQALGLRLEFSEGEATVEHGRVHKFFCSTPVYNGAQRFNAGVELFGITGPESTYLFGPDSYDELIVEEHKRVRDVSPADVITHLDELIRRRT